MSGVATAAVGAAVVGGYMGKRASDKAANKMGAAAESGNQLQYDMFREQQALMAPWVQSGGANLNRLNYAMYGQLPTAESMRLDPESDEYQNWVAQNPNWQAELTARPAFPDMQAQTNNILEGLAKTGPSFTSGNPIASALSRVLSAQQGASAGNTSPTLYKNPFTGEISTTAPTFNDASMGVEGGSLDPSWRFSMQDWYDSPEYQVYNQARNASIRQGQDAINAQSAARGMFGSGTWANALASNISDQYAKYNPASLAAARGAEEAARTQQYNMMVGMSSPSGAQQVANYAGDYGANAAQLMQAAGNAQAAGIVGGNNNLWNGINSGMNQIGQAYGNYQGQQNFNALLQAMQQGRLGAGGMNWNQINDMAGWNFGTDY
jgi:hypothetical protein